MQMNLKEALKQGKLKEFIKGRLQEKQGDQDKFDSTLASMTGKKKEAQEASSQEYDES